MSAFEDLGLLRAFVAVMECGSVAAGARRLRLSQPGLRRRLRTLEDRCGAALLRRDAAPMNVTETGRRLLAGARGIVALADAAGRPLGDDRLDGANPGT